MEKQVIIQVSPDGEVKIEAVGFRGTACEQATRALETAMGKVGKRSRKPEYHQQQAQQAKVGQ